MLGFSAWGVPAFTDLAGSAAEDVISVRASPLNTGSCGAEFVANAQARWNSMPSDPAQAYYDGVCCWRTSSSRWASIRKPSEGLTKVRTSLASRAR